jgi:hypothetical protein
MTAADAGRPGRAHGMRAADGGDPGADTGTDPCGDMSSRRADALGDDVGPRRPDAPGDDVSPRRPDVSTNAAPYERLAELADAELAACEAERPEDLDDLYTEAEAIRASLPGSPSAEAEPALRRAAAAQRRIGELLAARLAERGGDLERVHRAREAARAYATTANARASA